MSLKSSCRQCVFAEHDDTGQTSCKLDRASKLGIEEKDENNFFVLSRFCTTYRPEDWLKTLSVDDSLDINNAVMKEIHPRVGFFVIMDYSVESEALEKLKTTIEDIKNQELIDARYVVVINDRVEYNQDIYRIIEPMFDFDVTEYHLLQTKEKISAPATTIDQAFNHAKNGYVYVTYAGKSIDRSLIAKIHKRINIDMKRLVVIKPESGVDKLLFQTALFKFVNGNKTKLYQDETVDNRPFLEKIQEAAKESDDETFIDWSEFNAS